LTGDAAGLVQSITCLPVQLFLAIIANKMKRSHADCLVEIQVKFNLKEK